MGETGITIAVPTGYRLRDLGHLSDTDVRLFDVVSDKWSFAEPLDQYQLAIYPADANWPFGLATDPPEEALKKIVDDRQASHWTMEDSSATEVAAGKVLRLRFNHPSPDYLAHEEMLFLLRREGDLAREIYCGSTVVAAFAAYRTPSKLEISKRS